MCEVFVMSGKLRSVVASMYRSSLIGVASTIGGNLPNWFELNIRARAKKYQMR